MNSVIYGDYSGCPIVMKNNVFVIIGKNNIALNSENISSWEISSEKRSISAFSMIGRGFLGGLVLGPIGAGIGAFSALKGQSEKLIQITFKDGKKALITLDNDSYAKFKCYMS